MRRVVDGSSWPAVRAPWPYRGANCQSTKRFYRNCLECPPQARTEAGVRINLPPVHRAGQPRSKAIRVVAGRPPQNRGLPGKSSGASRPSGPEQAAIRKTGVGLPAELSARACTARPARCAWEIKKGHGKSIRRFAMTSILKRNPRVFRPPDGFVSALSDRRRTTLKTFFPARRCAEDSTGKVSQPGKDTAAENFSKKSICRRPTQPQPAAVQLLHPRFQAACSDRPMQT